MTNMAENQELLIGDRTAGAALAAARTAQNLSVADVARQLKLSVTQVAALEAGEFDRLPGPVFVRGFVRNYARLLRLDPERILESIAPASSAGEIRDAMPASKEIPFPPRVAPRWPRYGMAVLLILVGLAAYEFYGNPPAIVTVMKPVAPPTAPATATERASRDALPASPSDSTAPPGAARTDRPLEQAQEAQETSSTATKPPAAGKQSGEGELRFAFDKASWVQVRERESGKTIFTQLNPAGTEQRVSGRPPFLLVIGNAGGVRLIYNERPVDLQPYILRDDVARFTLE